MPAFLFQIVPFFCVQPVNFIHYFFGQLQTLEFAFNQRACYGVVGYKVFPVAEPGLVNLLLKLFLFLSAVNNVGSV